LPSSTILFEFNAANGSAGVSIPKVGKRYAGNNGYERRPRSAGMLIP